MIQNVMDIFAAFMSGDSWEMRQAFRTNGAWVVGAMATVIGAVLIHLLYRAVPFLERRLEPSVMIYTYLLIAAIIFVEVIRRFVFKVQAPWSTTLPPFLFLIMTWFGCSYNVSKRSHLAFSEIRMNLPRPLQMGSLTLDFVLWMVLSWIIVVTSMRIVLNSVANFQIMLGTDNVMQWWFLLSLPLSFLFLAARALGVWLEDLHRYRTGQSLVNPVAIGSD